MKKQYWKVFSTVILGLSILALAGCSQAANKKETSDKKQSFVRQDVDNLLLNISEVKTAKTGDNKNKLILTMDIENNNSQTKDIGSIDFYLEADGKKYDVDGDANAFGEPVDPTKKITKSLTFVVPEKLTDAKLVYKPMDKVLASWELTIPSPNE